MKDIDFEELDRAVSSVLGQKASAASDEKVSEDAKTTPGDSINTADQVRLDSPVISPVPSVTSEKPTPPMRRGRFMDVVRPASGTNKTSVDQLSPRTALSIQPIGDISTPDSPESVPDVSEQDIIDEPSFKVLVTNKSSSSPTTPDSSHLLEAETDDTGNFTPTDLELTDNKEKHLDEKGDEEPEAQSNELTLDADLDNVIDSTESTHSPMENTEEEAEPVATSLADTVPQTTPFLSDTKVEKRPLGGFPDNETDSISNKTLEDLDTQVPPTVPMPRELQADVIEVESPTQESHDTSSDLPFATSITPAAEPQDDGRVEGHPIFDTTSYHEPIIAVHESSVPAWLKWLLGLAVCLVLGAGVGYFLFTAGL